MAIAITDRPKGLTRRRLLGSACALAASTVRAQTPIGVHQLSRVRALPARLPLPPSRPTRTLAATPASPRSNTPAAIRDYQAWARRTFQQLAGALPERTPLNLRTIGAFERDRVPRREDRLREPSGPLRHRQSLPARRAARLPIPASCSRWATATTERATLSTNAAARDWCSSATWCSRSTPSARASAPTTRSRMDGSRACAPPPRSIPFPDGRCCWWARPPRARCSGTPCAAWTCWRRTRKVDPRRLASTGQSGGGTLTMILAAMDDRLAAAAVSSGNTENFAVSPFLAPGSSDDAEQDLIGSGPLAFDRWDLLWPIAPKPLLVAVSAHDFFGTYSPSYERSGREEFAEARARLLHAGRGRPPAVLRIAAAARALLSDAPGGVQLVRAIPAITAIARSRTSRPPARKRTRRCGAAPPATPCAISAARRPSP